MDSGPGGLQPNGNNDNNCLNRYPDVPVPLNLSRITNSLISTHHEWILWEQPVDGASLITALRNKFPNISSDSWSTRLDFGGVFFNGIGVFEERNLTFPARLEYYEPKFNISDADKIFPKLTSENIVYRDDDMALVWKPAKLPTMPAKEQRKYSVKLWAESVFGNNVHFPSRLDLSTSGLVAFSISKRMHSHIQNAFQKRTVKKTYLLASHKKSNWNSIQISLPIGESPSHTILREVNGHDAQNALTVFNYIGQSSSGLHTYEAFPKTGRTHQIRVHAAYLGIPIAGDNFYNGIEAETLHLSCIKLAISQPFLQLNLNLEAPFHFFPAWADCHNSFKNKGNT